MTQRHVGSRPEREGLWDWNLVSNRIHFSPRWLSLIGCDEHDIGPNPDSWLDRIHPDDRDRVVRELASVRTEGRGELDVPHRLRHSNGTYRWMSCRALVEREHGGQPIRLSGWHADVTAQEVIDPITGLPNHKLLLDRLALAIERAQVQPAFAFALLLVDLGRSSDADGVLLTAVARRLETCLRLADEHSELCPGHLVARLHGDQFAVLVEGSKDVAQAKVIADRLLGELLAPFSAGGDEVFLAPTIGVAVSATLYRSAEGMIRDAETALHRARTIGGGKCELFDTAILKSEEVQAGLDQALRDALERSEFQLFYQPIMSLTSNQIIGFEALVRWQHPTRGVVSPLEFIPLAEKTGFIVPLGRWILREACGQLKRWQDTLAADCGMSVNLSAAQLKHPALVEEVAGALAEAGLEARRLTLELTESMAMENPAAVKTVLMRLRAIGVHISIDDFGTGYSSLAHLRQFPVDTLKVDRSFILGLETNTDSSAIIGGLIAIGQHLGLQVIVEGVEHNTQLSRLRLLGCDAVQGYLCANPLDAQGAAQVLRVGLTLPPQGSVTLTTRVTGFFGRLVQCSWSRRRSAAVAAIAVLLIGYARMWPKPDIPASEPARSIQASSADPAARSTVQPSQPSLGKLPSDNSVASSMTAASLKVIHLHQFGGCSGRLTISSDGLKYAPDKHAKDAFAAPSGEFVHSTADDTLTVKTAAKTYRFKVAASGGNRGAQLRNFAAKIALLLETGGSF
jgi:EAL domain-containing protein (putative c-di-GMP-specific phosphodiesterase class I)/GGDEF domain-containing protein